ncbi:hypothetical protein GIB67_029951 [Kingdonia uniflora]|uniref:Uncharacterized protein n=1 Tax=Kingdonia uniflora TaxID=39325 RepID=A0A7J7MXS3_9MAGN|nr:hypothetical protein GIB67_029951 [Kingdonia uniflora]
MAVRQAVHNRCGYTRDLPKYHIFYVGKDRICTNNIPWCLLSGGRKWVVTNLRQTSRTTLTGSLSSSFEWIFDLMGIDEMYRSYEDTNLWNVVENVPQGVHFNFLKAERSLHRWALEDLRRIHAAEDLAVNEGGGVEMHVLEDAGHWVHADNPDGLFRILSPSFQGLKL